jgi:Arc/MetJ-type ribon-helix-helix transcriptional regulator
MKNKKMATDVGTIDVRIPATLYKKVQKRIEGTDFKDASDYVSYVLREVLTEADESTAKEQHFSKRDEEKIKDRLRSLGYLD